MSVTNKAFSLCFQVAGRSSYGSSCWSFWLTRTVSTSYRGQGTAGSSSCLIQTRWPGGGATERTSPKWTTRSSAAASDTTTTRTSFTKRRESATSTDLSVICRAYWDSPPKSCSLPVVSPPREIKMTNRWASYPVHNGSPVPGQPWPGTGPSLWQQPRPLSWYTWWLPWSIVTCVRYTAPTAWSSWWQVMVAKGATRADLLLRCQHTAPQLDC